MLYAGTPPLQRGMRGSAEGQARCPHMSQTMYGPRPQRQWAAACLRVSITNPNGHHHKKMMATGLDLAPRSGWAGARAAQIGFLGPAFFLTQLKNVHGVYGAVACMMASQGLDAFSQSGLYSNHQVPAPHAAPLRCQAEAP